MILTGLARIGRDAEIRYTPSGDAVANISLAFNYGKKEANADRPVQWIDASLWGKRAESLVQYLTKGTAVSVVLSDPHIEEFEGKNGKTSKLVARIVDIEFAGNKSDGASERQPQAAQQHAKPAAAPSPRGGGASGFSDLEDDLPF